MKSSTINEIKKELVNLDEAQLLDFCLRLAKYKKDNKELLSYMLFDAHDEQSYITKIKAHIDDEFLGINRSNLYWAKKSLRKILRNTNKYIRYSGKKQTEADLLIYFCQKMRTSGISYHSSTALNNLYHQQLKKINKAIANFHDDLRYDYQKEMEAL